MAFPNDIDNFLEASDIETTDVTLFNKYQSEIAEGDFQSAQQTLASIVDGAKKLMTAERFNTLINAITNIENFYLGNNGVKKYIDDQINAFSDIGIYSDTINYNEGNIVSCDSILFKCKQANGPDTIVITPQVTDNWDSYWEFFLDKQDGQIIVSETQPENLDVGTLWFKIDN